LAYIPPYCERFVPCLEGWICCECGHFSGKEDPRCYNCQHERCPVLLEIQPPKEKKKHGPAPSFPKKGGPGRPRKKPDGVDEEHDGG
jgi:hypothetical protein